MKSEEKKKLNWSSIKQGLRIYAFIKPYKWSFIIGLILLAFSSILFMFFPMAAGEMANTAIGKSKWHIPVNQFGLIFLAILIVQGLFSYWRTTLFAKVSEYGIADIRKAVYQKIITQDMHFFENNRVGELTSRLTADTEQLQNAFSISLAEFIRQAIVLVSGLIIIAWLTPKLSFIMLLCFPVIVVASVLFGKFIRKLSKQRQDSLAESNVVVEESFQSFPSVKAYTNEWFESNRFTTSIDKMLGISMHYAKMRGLFFIFVITVLFGAMFFILWRGALLVQAGEMAAGDLFSFIIYTGIIGGAIASLGNIYTAIAGAMGASERIQEILDRDSEVAIQDSIAVERIPIQGHIEFQNINFSYPARKDLQILKEINFEVSKGKKIAFVGSSGAGKSTIAQLIMRFFNPDSGNILIDHSNINNFNIIGYRKNIAIVPQEILLFGGTIRENIQYGNPNANPELVERAAELSNSLEFIQTFPDKMETIVGERGIKLSGGQRQRIAIARAILRDPAILILDEATSSLDAESEKLVQDALEKLMKDRTSIIIAHRLSTIKDADNILVLENGKIVEQGSHDVLMRSDLGVYRNLVNLQVDAENA